MGYQGEGGRAAYCFASIVALNEVFGFAPIDIPCGCRALSLLGL